MKIERFVFTMLVFVVSLAMVANAGLVAEYDASKVTDMKPGEVTPAWSVAGFEWNDDYCSDEGDYLWMHWNDYATQKYGNWTSPTSQTVSMVKGSTDYSIQVKLQPLGDMRSTGNSYEYGNIEVRWSDNVNWYLMGFDKDSDDAGAGTLGRVTRNKYPLNTVIGDIDWSVPHEVTVAYVAAQDVFKYYLDGVYSADVSPADLSNGATQSGTLNRVEFGDSTTGGIDLETNWNYVRLYDTAIPEPATMALLGFGGFTVLFRRKKK